MGASILSPVSDFLGTGVSGPVGVGGARPQDAGVMQNVPGTAYQYDPATGQYYLAPGNGVQGGTLVAGAPNLNNLTSGDVAIQQQYLQQQQQAQQQAAATRAGQNTLAQNLSDVIAGRSPSLSSIQLQQGLQQIAANQASGAAGASGDNAFAARRLAARNTATAGADLNGQAAAARAAETSAARNSLASLYTGMSSADASAANNATSGVLGTGQLATTSQGDILTAQQKAKEDQAKANGDILGRFGSAIASAF